MIIKNGWEYEYTAEYNTGLRQFEVIATHKERPTEQIMLIVPIGAYEAMKKNREEEKQWLATRAG